MRLGPQRFAPMKPAWRRRARQGERPLLFEGARDAVRVFFDHGEQHASRLVGAVRTLLPIPHCAEREVEPQRELLPRQVQFLAQDAHARRTASALKLSLARRRGVRV